MVYNIKTIPLKTYFGSQFKIGILLYKVFFLKTFFAFALPHEPIDFNCSDVDFLVLSVTS